MLPLFALVIVLLLLPTEAAADYFTDYSMDIVLDPDEIHQTIKATFVIEETIARVSLRVDARPRDLVASLDGEPATATVQSADGSYSILIQAPHILEQNVSHSLIVSYTTDAEYERTSKGVLYSNSFTASSAINRYSLAVALPAGATIAFENDAPLISPVASLTTDGHRIRLVWRTALGNGESFTAVVVHREEDSPLAFYLLGIVALLVILFVLYNRGYFTTTLQKMKPDGGQPQDSPSAPPSPEAQRVSLTTIRDTLGADENKIVDIVLASGGKALQSVVVRETGFSKSKVSKVLRGLEMKGVLVKTPYGKTNVLKLADKYQP